VTVEPPLSAGQVKVLLAFAREDHRAETDVPGIWCQWVPTADGTAIEWDGNEKFYESEEWMRYLIGTFLQPSGHRVNGTIEAQGDDPHDMWQLVVRDNVVTTRQAVVSYADEIEERPQPIRVVAEVEKRKQIGQ